MMDLFRAIDANCERLAPGLWGEPLNILSNITFFIALIACARLYREHVRARGKPDPAAFFLLFIIGAIAVGSMLFHSFAVAWSLMADIIPIILFVVQYLMLFCTRLLNWPVKKAFLMLLVLIPAALVLPRIYIIPELGLSNFYLPALYAMLYITVLLATVRHPATVTMLGCCGIFTVSLAFRTIDKPICGLWPYGTHFLWHMLNALVVYVLVRTLFVYGMKVVTQPAARSPHPAKIAIAN